MGSRDFECQLDELPAYARKLKVMLGSPDAVTGSFELCCHQMVEVRLVKFKESKARLYSQA